jgi:hypothetical protein
VLEVSRKGNGVWVCVEMQMQQSEDKEVVFFYQQLLFEVDKQVLTGRKDSRNKRKHKVKKKI